MGKEEREGGDTALLRTWPKTCQVTYPFGQKLVTCHTGLQGSLGIMHTGASSTKRNGFWGAISNLCHRISLGRDHEGCDMWVRMAFVCGTSKKRSDLKWTSLWGRPRAEGPAPRWLMPSPLDCLTPGQRQRVRFSLTMTRSCRRSFWSPRFRSTVGSERGSAKGTMSAPREAPLPSDGREGHASARWLRGLNVIICSIERWRH